MRRVELDADGVVRRGVDRLVVLGALSCAAGLATFLVVARPTGTSGQLAEGAQRDAGSPRGAAWDDYRRDDDPRDAHLM